MIQVSELHFSTEDGVKVLEDIHLHVEQGELMAILGPAASGKSLLLGLLGAQIAPQRGQILVHGRNVVRLAPGKILSLRQRIGVCPQGFVPLPRTVHENVTFKLRAMGNYREQAQEKVLYALETTGLIRKQGVEALELSSTDRILLGIAINQLAFFCHNDQISFTFEIQPSSECRQKNKHWNDATSACQSCIEMMLEARAKHQH